MTINQSRIENGKEICNTCTKEVRTPWREMSKDENGYMQVRFGCVSESHTGKVFDEWHLTRRDRTVKR